MVFGTSETAITIFRCLFYPPKKTITSGKINSYLADMDEQAQDMFLRLVKEYAGRQGVTERLKAENQLLRCVEGPLRPKQRQSRELKNLCFRV